MSPTKTAQTVHGEVQYETVECSSCGEEVAKDEAFEFEMRKDVDGIYRSKVNRKGWACEYCANEGPINFPSGKQSQYAKSLFLTLFWDQDYDMLHAPKAILVVTAGMILLLVAVEMIMAVM